MNGRRAMLELRWVHPPPRLRRVILEPGQLLRVGRTDLAHFQVPNDRQMSGVHFEISWDGASCQVQHRASTATTLLNEQPVSIADVKSGDWIRAGNSLFVVHFEGATLRPLPDDSPDETEKKSCALIALRAESQPLFALVDAARDPRVRQLLQESVDEVQSLYDGVKGEGLGNVAPYLVRLSKDSGLLERLVREGWGRSWGVYLTSRASFDEVRRHFRRILLVDLQESGHPTRRVYFRFYDPRVLRDFLPVCTLQQKPKMYLPNAFFLLEAENGDLLRFGACAMEEAKPL